MIHVHTAVVANTVDYALYMVNNAKFMARDPHELRFSVYCSDDLSHGLVINSPQFRRHNVQVRRVVVLTGQGAGQGSLQHAFTIRSMLRSFVPDAHNAIIDGDTVILRRDWDFVIEMLLLKHHLAGVAFEPLDKVYQNFPMFAWIVFRPGLTLHDFDPNPQKATDLLLTDVRLAKTFDLPLGTSMRRDTGWKLPCYAYDRNWSAVSFPVVPNPLVFNRSDPYLEHAFQNGPFVAHMQRSIKIPYQSKTAQDFYQKCEKFVLART